MKTIVKIFIFLLMSSFSIHAADMQKYLNDTRVLVKKGKYKKALSQFLWFHKHSLEHEPAMYGVRLSYALFEWKELGNIYPPALKAMIKVRDDSTNKIYLGSDDVNLFHDVESLNEVLNNDSKTLDLFRYLDRDRKDMAEKCWDIVKDLVIKTKSYELAQRYIDNPVFEWDKIKERYNRNKKGYNILGKSYKSYNENMLVKESIILIKLSLSIEDEISAKIIQMKALEIIKDSRLKNAIVNGI